MRVQFGRGTGNRFADDLSGNHIERQKNREYSIGIKQLEAVRHCPSCGKVKPKRGGLSARAGKKWKCADCKALLHGITA